MFIDLFSLSDTEKLLIFCSRGNLDNIDCDKAVTFISKGVDWSKLYDLAIANGVDVLVYNALKQLKQCTDIPTGIIARFKENYLVINLRNSFWQEELERILYEFEEAGIFCIPLKGITLSYILYKNANSRGKSADIDILIKEEDRKAAEEKLIELGYNHTADLESEEYKWAELFIKDGFCLELHWDVSGPNRTRRRIETLFKDLEEYKINGLKFITFNPETLLIYLSIHLANSSAFRFLRHVADLNQFLCVFKDKLKWGSLIEKARDCGAYGCLYYSLLMTNKIYGLRYSYRELGLLEPDLLKRYFLGIFINPKVTLRHTFRTKIIDRYLQYIMLELTEAKKFSDLLGIFQRKLAASRIIRPFSNLCK